MPFVFIIVGLVLLFAGALGNTNELLGLLKGDITGKNNFIYWIVSILIIGSIGYVQDLRTLSRAFLVLVIVVLVLNEDKNGNGGFFAKFQDGISQITKGSAA